MGLLEAELSSRPGRDDLSALEEEKSKAIAAAEGLQEKVNNHCDILDPCRLPRWASG